ncbi:MAG: thioredoxin domain-containing protein [Bdellovibrionaceae bacterium]|nr:thioredoxin domain-containing protein [Pseudobdellovibrionaceae bacterium]
METKSKKLIFVAFLSTISAIGLHIYLSYKYYSLKYGLGTSSACNINDKFNCDVASTSHFADLFGVPIATLGALTNFVVFILMINFFLSTKESRRAFHFGFLLSGFVFGVSIVMGIISMAFLTAYCPFCIAAYILSAITFGCLYLVKDRDLSLNKVVPSLFIENKGTLYLFVAIPLLGLFINWNINKRIGGDRLDMYIYDSIQSWKSKEVANFDLTKGLSKGATDSKFVIVEFADYLCPHCKHANDPLKTFISTYPQAKFVFKPYPLDGTCNTSPGLQGQGDGIRCRLSFASYCAEKLFNDGFKYHDFIFDNQEFFHGVASNDDVDKKICSFDESRCAALKECMGSEDAINWVKSAAKEGEDAKITGTPTIFVNGKKLDGGQNFMLLKNLYSELN